MLGVADVEEIAGVVYVSVDPVFCLRALEGGFDLARENKLRPTWKLVRLGLTFILRASRQEMNYEIFLYKRYWWSAEKKIMTV